MYYVFLTIALCYQVLIISLFDSERFSPQCVLNIEIERVEGELMRLVIVRVWPGHAWPQVPEGHNGRFVTVAWSLFVRWSSSYDFTLCPPFFLACTPQFTPNFLPHGDNLNYIYDQNSLWKISMTKKSNNMVIITKIYTIKK